MDKIRKIGFVSLMSLIFLIAASLTAFGTGYLPCPKREYYMAYLAGGVLILILSGLAVFIVRKNTAVNVICFMANSVALGLCIRSWYILRELENNLLTLFLVCIACIAYLWIFFGLCLIPAIKRHIKLFFWVWLFLSFIGYTVAVALTETTFLSTFGYYMLVVSSFIYAIVSHSEDKKQLMRALTLSTYTVVVVAIIVAVLIFAEDADLDSGQADARLLVHRLGHVVQQGAEALIKGGNLPGSLPQQGIPFINHIPNCHFICSFL